MSLGRSIRGKCDRVFFTFVPWCALVVMISATGSSRAPAQCHEQQKLTALDAVTSARFGTAVSVSADLALVGAPQPECELGGACGAAYVRRLDGPN